MMSSGSCLRRGRGLHSVLLNHRIHELPSRAYPWSVCPGSLVIVLQWSKRMNRSSSLIPNLDAKGFATTPVSCRLLSRIADKTREWAAKAREGCSSTPSEPQYSSCWNATEVSIDTIRSLKCLFYSQYLCFPFQIPHGSRKRQ